MPDIAQGGHADLVLAPGDAYQVSTPGTATVVPAYGLPAGTTTVTANTQTFGPYAAAVKLAVNAVTGKATYSLLGANVLGRVLSPPGGGTSTDMNSLTGMAIGDSFLTVDPTTGVATMNYYRGVTLGWVASGGVGGASWRQSATRCFPVNTNINASFTRGMSRSYHFASNTGLVNPRVEYMNAVMNTTEVAGSAGTLDVSLEYPIGTYTRANECIAAGNGPVAFPPGNTLFTFNVTVPPRAAFALRPMQRNASGILWNQSPTGFNQFGAQCPEDFMDIGTSDSLDKVMGGVIGAGNGICFYPMVIASQTSAPAFLIAGTSRATGGVGGVSDTFYDLGIEARVVGKKYGYTNVAAAGTLLVNWNSGTHTYLNQLIAKGYWNYVINEYGINDVPASTAAVVVTRRTAFATAVKAALPTIKVIGETLYPYIGTSDVDITKANQTIGVNQQRVFELNNNARAGIPGEDYCWDSADGLDPFREGKYPVSRNPNDTSVTPASFTGSITGTTLTVTAISVGALAIGMPLYDAGGNIKDSLRIVSQLTGTVGSTGTYQVNLAYSGFPNPSAVASTTITSAGFATRDGLHAQISGEEMMVRNAGPALLAIVTP